QAGAAQPFGLYPHAHLLVPVPDLRAQVHLDPDHHVVRITQDLQVKRVPALLEVGQEDGVVDVAQRVAVTPSDPHHPLEHRAHPLAPHRPPPSRSPPRPYPAHRRPYPAHRPARVSAEMPRPPGESGAVPILMDTA